MLDIELPYSKSVRARVAVIRSLAGLSCSWNNDSDDTRIIDAALSDIDNATHESITVNLQHSGTALRFLLAYAASKPGVNVTLTGSSRLCERPIAELVDALTILGADIEYVDRVGCAPLIVRGRKLDGGEVSVRADISSQFVSALMLVAPYLNRGLSINLVGKPVSQPYIRLTEYVMTQCGAEVCRADNRIVIQPGAYRPDNIARLVAERDWSAALMWFAAVSVTGMPLLLKNLTLDTEQPDRTAVQAFSLMGVSATYTENGVLVERHGRKKRFLQVDCNDTPDSVMPIVVAAILSDIQFRITGIETLKVKECDRAAALVAELLKCGYVLEYNGVDSLMWSGKRVERQNGKPLLCCHNDHRMAMALSMFNLVEVVDLDHPEVVSKSYDVFFDEFEKLKIKQKGWKESKPYKIKIRDFIEVP